MWHPPPPPRGVSRTRQAFGCGYVLDQKGPDGQLARAGPDAGIPTIDPELGGCVGWDEECIEQGVAASTTSCTATASSMATTTRARRPALRVRPVWLAGRRPRRVQARPRRPRRPRRALFEVTDVFGDARRPRHRRPAASSGGRAASRRSHPASTSVRSGRTSIRTENHFFQNVLRVGLAVGTAAAPGTERRVCPPANLPFPVAADGAAARPRGFEPTPLTPPRPHTPLFTEDAASL